MLSGFFERIGKYQLITEPRSRSFSICHWTFFIRHLRTEKYPPKLLATKVSRTADGLFSAEMTK
jgi:hypothetical protein